MSNQRPRITFDENGVCSACNYSEKKFKKTDWDKRKKMLEVLCNEHRSKDGSWDVIVPCSAGKDSSSVAHKLKHKYDMHPLTVTWANNLDTDIGKQNLDNFIDSGFDNVYCKPNGIVNRRLARVSLEVMGDVFQTFIYGVVAFPLKIATAYDIPLIFYGENGEVEYGGDSKNEELGRRNTTEDILKHYVSGYPVEYWKKYGFSDKDLECYKLPSQQKIKDLGVENHFFGFYEKWIPRENAIYSSKYTGFKGNPDGRSDGTFEGYASLDDKLDGIHYYFSFLKFGTGRATHGSAHEIRDGDLTREQGIEYVRKYDGEFPIKHFKESLEYLGITEERFWEIADSWRSDHIWEKEGNDWKLRNTIYDSSLHKEKPGYLKSLEVLK
jgi:N-acetyl sugar amidotransferase